jgi:hypothetical protein
MFSVKCPICSNPLIKRITLDDRKYYFDYKCSCAAVTEVFTYRLDYQTEKPLKIHIYLDLDETSYLEFIWYESGYFKIDPGRWWEVNLRSFNNDISQRSLAKGNTYLSPQEGWDLLNRFKKLLIFL